jgi:hypothetical protein
LTIKPHSDAEIKNEWRYKSAPSIRLHDMEMESLTFPLVLYHTEEILLQSIFVACFIYFGYCVLFSAHFKDLQAVACYRPHC